VVRLFESRVGDDQSAVVQNQV